MELRVAAACGIVREGNEGRFSFSDDVKAQRGFAASDQLPDSSFQ